MISIQSYQETEGVIIFLDNKGIDDMINYLNYIKAQSESFNLTKGNELDDFSTNLATYEVNHLKIVSIEV